MTLPVSAARLWLAGAVFCAALSLPGAGVAADRLVIDYVISNSPQRSAMINIINQFSAANPDIQVVHNGYPQEQYKQDLITRLRNGQTDLAFWYAGANLREAARNKLLAPLDADTVALLKKKKFVPATIEGTRIDGEVYGFPLYYYVWGMLYRKSLFERMGLRPPATWSEFLQVCEKLKAAGITPIGLGAKSAWPAAAWFDYLNLRINGLEFHRKLLNGDAHFTDPKVHQVFDVWGGLLRKGYFFAPTMDQEIDRVLPYLYRQHVGMMLTGSFIAARFPAAIAPDMGFFSFPSYSAEMPQYEEAPMDVLVLPANSAHVEARKRFLTFLAESGATRVIAQADQTLAAQSDGATQPVLGEATNAILGKAAGLTYFFDRDARTELVTPSYEGLRQFLKPPYDADQTIRYIEDARRKSGAESR
ncbi:ABC transporter substrate-binding protein [Duganella guangzhouensis]|nr:ABC transporter substrate-binding protein [Duganella guangzhouensis]